MPLVVNLRNNQGIKIGDDIYIQTCAASGKGKQHCLVITAPKCIKITRMDEKSIVDAIIENKTNGV